MRDRTARLLAASALVVAALGWTGVGEAVREAVLPPNSVGTAQLRNNAVTTGKIRSGSVTSSDVKNASLRASDLAPGTIPERLFVTRRALRDVTGVGEFELEVACDAGQVPLAGGGGFLSTTTAEYVGNQFYGSLVNSGPLNGKVAADDRGTATGWKITARSAGGTKRLAAYVVCTFLAAPEPPTGTTPKPPATSAPTPSAR